MHSFPRKASGSLTRSSASILAFQNFLASVVDWEFAAADPNVSENQHCQLYSLSSADIRILDGMTHDEAREGDGKQHCIGCTLNEHLRGGNAFVQAIIHFDRAGNLDWSLWNHFE
jgi:hypothetical protein